MFRRAVYKKAKHCITCVYFMSPLKHWRSLAVITHNGAFWWYYSTSFFWFFIVKNSLMRVFLSSMELLMFGLGFNNSDTELYNAHTISVSLGLRNQTALQHSLTGSVLRNCSSGFFFPLAGTDSVMHPKCCKTNSLYFQKLWWPHKWVQNLWYNIFQVASISAKNLSEFRLHVTYLRYNLHSMCKPESIYISIFPWGKVQKFYCDETNCRWPCVEHYVSRARKSWMHIPECTRNQYTYYIF